MLNKTVFPARPGRYAFAERPSFQAEFTHELPDVPALPETLLLMDLQVNEHSVDLREISRLVLDDLGATVQILRLAGRQYGCAEDRPHRIEDCIADLGLQACLEAAAAKTIHRDNRNQAIAEVWEHSRTIAFHCRLIAEDMLGINPDEAYLVGLFHAIGLLPSMLGWDWQETGPSDGAMLGRVMADDWALPQCVIEFFTELEMPASAGRWSAIVHAAHQMSERSPMNCIFEQDLRPQLCKRA